MRPQGKRPPRFAAHVEHLEERNVMTADPLGGAVEAFAVQDVAPPLLEHATLTAPPIEQTTLATPDFWIDPADQVDFEEYFDEVEQALAEAHAQTGWLNVRNNYGFTGLGQTVAVIDSGIAWDHFALGGGLGSNYRVVGGWDFSGENDPDPYDDGPSGGHGTHVSGIIGSSSSTQSGVAPGVDFVGLRVFDDAGAGYFSWVENALRWVHENRNSFENPITTVNLSLGVSSWNSDTIPTWAMLEDEFAQLEADGIFVAVAAGNYYSSYNRVGLSYPAASSYVVPVMSTDDAGNLSYFSQRLNRAIAAPGRSITSTVPDYKGNNNGVKDDFATMSGTSMAAPYVAGAAALVRQAMEFVGRTGINQDKIYDHLMSTADTFVDATSKLSFQRLNLGRAIDALMPGDDFGSTAAAAYDMGVLSTSGEREMSGTLGRLNDADYFRFTAAATGQVKLRATSDGNFTWALKGAGTQAGGEITIQVVAGQSYAVGLAAAGGVSHFQLDVSYLSSSGEGNNGGGNSGGGGSTGAGAAMEKAFELDQGLSLSFTGNYYTNWGGRNEKWMQAGDKTWYFVTPDGAVRHWSGESLSDLSAHTLVANLSSTHYAHPSLIHNAPNPNGNFAQVAQALDAELGFENPTSYSENWAGMSEKWLRTGDNRWYFVTPGGSLYEWDGQQDFSSCRLVGQLDAAAYATPAALHDAASAPSNLPQLAYQLDQQLGLQFAGNYFQNWGGTNEKWMRAGDSSWYFITPAGQLFHWNGQRDLATSTLTATLAASYHANPGLLHHATPPAGGQQTAGQSVVEGSGNQSAGENATAALGATSVATHSGLSNQNEQAAFRAAMAQRRVAPVARSVIDKTFARMTAVDGVSGKSSTIDRETLATTEAVIDVLSESFVETAAAAAFDQAFDQIERFG